MVATPAGHVIASLAPLHPEVALCALLKFCSLYKFDKLFIIFIERVGDSKLLTILSEVKLHSTVEAVMLMAVGAVELGVSIFKHESELAVGCRAPRDVLLKINHC